MDEKTLAIKAQDFLFVGEDIFKGIERAKLQLSTVDFLNAYSGYMGIYAGNSVKFYTIEGECYGVVESILYELGNYEFPVRVKITINSDNKTHVLEGNGESIKLYSLKKTDKKKLVYGEFGKYIIATISYNGKNVREEFHNVTQVAKYQDYKKRDKIAFESDIHGTGNTYSLNAEDSPSLYLVSYSMFKETGKSESF